MTQLDLPAPTLRVRKPITSVRLTVGSYILVCLLLCLFGLGVPQFRQIFEDFKTDPPALTRWSLGFSRWVLNDYGWVWLLLAPAIVPIAITQLFWRPQTSQQSVLRTLIGAGIVFALVVLITAGTMIALFLPMMSLSSIQSTSSPR